jgi:hypothetical protein
MCQPILNIAIKIILIVSFFYTVKWFEKWVLSYIELLINFSKEDAGHHKIRKKFVTDSTFSNICVCRQIFWGILELNPTSCAFYGSTLPLWHTPSTLEIFFLLVLLVARVNWYLSTLYFKFYQYEIILYFHDAIFPWNCTKYPPFSSIVFLGG